MAEGILKTSDIDSADDVPIMVSLVQMNIIDQVPAGMTLLITAGLKQDYGAYAYVKPSYQTLAIGKHRFSEAEIISPSELPCLCKNKTRLTIRAKKA